jgi:hypothetical protein
MEVFSRRKVLALLSQVTGMVQAMVKRTETFGKSLGSQSLIDFDGEDGLFSGGIGIYLMQCSSSA